MAGREIDHLQATITAVSTTGYATLASTTGFYKNAIVYLVDSSGANSKRAIITSVSTTQLGILFRETDAGTSATYGHSDITAYNGGSVTQHGQFVYNINDLPLS